MALRSRTFGLRVLLLAFVAVGAWLLLTGSGCGDPRFAPDRPIEEGQREDGQAHGDEIDAPLLRGREILGLDPREGGDQTAEARFFEDGVRVRIRDRMGKPAVGVRIGLEALTLDEPRGKARSLLKARTDWEGVARLHGLDPEEPVRLVIPRSPMQGLCGRTIEPWLPHSIDLVLDPLRSVRGQVVDERGDAADGARVYWRLPGWDKPRWVAAGADGRFVFSGLEPGDVELMPAHSESAREGPGIYTKVRAGSEQVRLVLPVTAPLSIQVRDWPSGAKGRCIVRIAGSDEVLRVVDVGPAGRAFLGDLDESKAYAVWVHIAKGTRYAYSSALWPGPHLCKLPLEEGKPVVIRLPLPERASVRYVRVRGGPVLYPRSGVRGLPRPSAVPVAHGTVRGVRPGGRTAGAGTKEWKGLLCVPPGTWIIEAEVKLGLPWESGLRSGVFRGTAGVEAGDDVTLTLERVASE